MFKRNVLLHTRTCVYWLCDIWHWFERLERLLSIIYWEMPLINQTKLCFEINTVVWLCSMKLYIMLHKQSYQICVHNIWMVCSCCQLTDLQADTSTLHHVSTVKRHWILAISSNTAHIFVEYFYISCHQKSANAFTSSIFDVVFDRSFLWQMLPAIH